MLWLASLLGVFAIGAVTLVDGDIPPEDDEPVSEHDELSARLADQDEAATDEPAADDSITSDLSSAPAPEPSGVAPFLLINQVLSGTDDGDQISGGAGDDQIGGYGGDDAVYGGAGDDDLFGDDGDDTLLGGAGDDLLHGDDGDDYGLGDDGADQIYGHNGDDTLSGGAQNDILHGGADDDAIDGGAGADALHGGLGNDSLSGGAGQDTLFGGWGDDLISGLAPTPDADADYLNGGGGDDVILTGAGDIVTAGDGLDQIMLGDWTADSGHDQSAAEIMDFNAAEDSLLMVWDLDENPAPQIDVVVDDADPDISHVIVNGSEIATVHGAIRAEDIVVVDPASSLPVALTGA